MRTGDTPCQRAPEADSAPARPADHHARVAVPDAHVVGAETLRGVETVIVDEIHAMATTKRGAHLALSLERLEQVTDRPPQRIGLSATQRPLEETARFLGGYVGDDAAARADRRHRRSQGARDRGRRAGRRHERARQRRDAARRTGRRRAPVEHLAQHLPAGARTRAGAPLARSSSATPAVPPSGWRPGSTSSTRSSTARPSSSWSGPTTGRSRASSGSIDRRSAQARRAAGDRRHVVARTRHRHGCRRPRDPDRVAGRRQPRAAADRTRRALGRRSPARARSSPSTAATWSRRRSWRGA